MPILERPSGLFLSNKDVKTGEIITFIDAGEEKPGKNFNGKDVIKFVIKVRLPDGEEKLADLNNTSKKNMMDEYGENSDEWIGKDARIEIVTQKVSKDFKDVLYLTAPMKNLKGDLIHV